MANYHPIELVLWLPVAFIFPTRRLIAMVPFTSSPMEWVGTMHFLF
jgi:hypothetical protein